MNRKKKRAVEKWMVRDSGRLGTGTTLVHHQVLGVGLGHRNSVKIRRPGASLQMREGKNQLAIRGGHLPAYVPRRAYLTHDILTQR